MGHLILPGDSFGQVGLSQLQWGQVGRGGYWHPMGKNQERGLLGRCPQQGITWPKLSLMLALEHPARSVFMRLLGS